MMKSREFFVAACFIVAFLVSTIAFADADRSVMEFTRHYDTCDANGEDNSIREGATNVIWAFRDEPVSASTGPLYHTERGSKSQVLRGSVKKEPLPADAQSLDIRVSTIGGAPIASVNGSDHGQDERTFYWCTHLSASELPGAPSDFLTKKRHVVQVEILNDNPAKLHHIILYTCDDIDQDYSGLCPYMPSSGHSCNFKNVVAAWAIGGDSIHFPLEAGMPMGGADGFNHIMMEVHYDNYDLAPFTDSSGVRLHFTESLRQHDLGVMAVGSGGPGIAIPPGNLQHDWNFECPQTCTDQLDTDMNVSSFFLHSHRVGRSIALRHVRDGQELPLLAEEPYYDFNYQTQVAKTPHTVVKPGDRLLLKCTYDTSQRTDVTYGGASGQEEMCLAYLSYFPKHSMHTCDTHIRTGTNLATCAGGNATKADTTCFVDGGVMHCPTGASDSEASDFTPLAAASQCTHNNTIAADRFLPTYGGSVAQFNASRFAHATWLDDNETVQLMWNDEPDNEQIRVALSAPTVGWLGVGFSSSGGMHGADIALGWLDSQLSVHFDDRFATQNGITPNIDQEQNVFDVVLYGGSGTAQPSTAAPTTAQEEEAKHTSPETTPATLTTMQQHLTTSPNEHPPATTGSPRTTACAADRLVCPDGSTVCRDPANNCAFRPCPPHAIATQSAQSVDSPAASTTSAAAAPVAVDVGDTTVDLDLTITTALATDDVQRALVGARIASAVDDMTRAAGFTDITVSFVDITGDRFLRRRMLSQDTMLWTARLLFVGDFANRQAAAESFTVLLRYELEAGLVEAEIKAAVAQVSASVAASISVETQAKLVKIMCADRQLSDKCADPNSSSSPAGLESWAQALIAGLALAFL